MTASLQRPPWLVGRYGEPCPTCPPHSPWLSSGSQKHFLSSGKQLQVPKPALIPQRSPGSCPPMMLPPGDKGSHSASWAACPARTTQRSVGGPSLPASCLLLRPGVGGVGE